MTDEERYKAELLAIFQEGRDTLERYCEWSETLAGSRKPVLSSVPSVSPSVFPDDTQFDVVLELIHEVVNRNEKA